jgi:hypothetical protein
VLARDEGEEEGELEVAEAVDFAEEELIRHCHSSRKSA